MAKKLHKGDATRRRWKIIDASRSAEATLLPQLLARLDSDETYDNKRHIVRALDSIGGPLAEEKLLQLLTCQTGLILGEIAQSLGKLGSQRALASLKELSLHESEWVRQNVAFAIRELRSRR